MTSASPCVYMDNHATTRVDPRVVEAMLPYFTEEYGNPGSVHEPGQSAREAVEAARKEIATAIGATPQEIVFTSGATESDNLAILGVATRRRRRGDHLVSVVTEHAAVLGPLERLEKSGHQVTLLSVEERTSPKAGWLDPQRVADTLRDETCLVSVMLANNEMGVVQPLADIAAVCRERNVFLHCDATQAVGKIPVNVRTLGVDLMSFSAHKIYGPKGIGALYVRARDPRVRLEPLLTGGGQEMGRRSGTLNVPGIVGFAKAVRLCLDELPSESQRLAHLRDELAQGLLDSCAPVELVGPELAAQDSRDRPLRLPGNLNLTLEGLDGEAILMRLPHLALSSGATCSSADSRPSHVLGALGYSDDQARCSLRFGLGRYNHREEIDRVVESVASAAGQLRRAHG